MILILIFISPGATSLGHRHSWVESAAAMKGSVTDIHSNLDSGSSTPGIQRVRFLRRSLVLETRAG